MRTVAMSLIEEVTCSPYRENTFGADADRAGEAVADLGEAEHPLDDPDRMLDPGPHFGLGAVFRPLDLIWVCLCTEFQSWKPDKAPDPSYSLELVNDSAGNEAGDG